MTAVQRKLFDDILAERARQDEKWGPDRNQMAEKWHLIVSEEVGEFADATLSEHFERQRHELVQVAASALAALEAHERAQLDPDAFRVWMGQRA